MIIGEKDTDLKDWQGDKNFAFWQKLGDFIETKAKKLPTSPGLVSPVEWHLNWHKKKKCWQDISKCSADNQNVLTASVV